MAMPVMSSGVILLVDLESGETINDNLAFLVGTHVHHRVVRLSLVFFAGCSCTGRSRYGGSGGCLLA